MKRTIKLINAFTLLTLFSQGARDEFSFNQSRTFSPERRWRN